MGTVVHLNGRLHYMSRSTYVETRRPKPDYSMGVTAEGTPISPAPIAAPLRPFQSGEVLFDPVEKVPYRVAKANLDPLQGWASSGFWQKYLSISHADLVLLVQAEQIDAAVKEGSLFRYYRPRDVTVLKQSTVWKRIRRRVTLRQNKP